MNNNKNKTRKKTTEKTSLEKSVKEGFLIIGIGASAGGVQALKGFFENVPADSNAAYVVILHLSPDHDSQLTHILQTVAKIPVTKVEEKVRVEANHVYVISPNESLSMRDGHIVVSPINTVEKRRAPVDIFFRTLAESHCARAVAVVLSGTGADGSMGIKRVKERGGAAFVQNPNEAGFGEMPRNSIATELIDKVLNVAEIPAKIIAYQKNLGKIVIPIEPESREEEQQKALREIFKSLRVRTGHDFANYKRATVLRRIERRINVRELSDLPEYAAYLKETPEEIQALLKDLLISVTNFFRDKEAFQHLERDVIPRILTDKKSSDEIRLWVAGCATGEEAYSLAMMLCEQIEHLPETPSVQIFATDIDEDAIAAARNGFYTLNDAADVSPERLERFFTQEKHGYRVQRELRELILFANHNLLKDAPFSHLDLATCRNLLIYFNKSAQERVLETFHFALKPHGYLFLGSSESIDGAGDLYSAFNREERIFQSRQISPRISYPVPDLSPSLRFDKLPNSELREIENRPLERISYGDLHGRILEQFAPPSIIVNAQYDIVHVSENAGHFLQISDELSPNLFKLIQPELRLPVSTAVYQAVQNQKNVVAENLQFHNGGEQIETINVSVRPVLRQNGEAAEGFILIIFEPTENASDAPETEKISVNSEPIARQLEKELMRSQSRFQTSLKNSEIQAEELKASNEELQAINEELRATTEELETGKEELQSVNEELITVNQELKIKIEEISNSNNDLQNLINSTNIGTVFLDRNFRIKFFTPIAGEIFNLIPADNGRHLSDITHKLEDENLTANIEKVLNDLQPIEREVRTTDGNFYLMQITPYRTSEDHIGGTIITFVNITGRIRAERELSKSLENLAHQRIFDTTLSTITDFAYTFDKEGRFIYSNKPLLDLLGISLEEITGKNFYDLNYPDDLAARLQNQIQEVFDTKKTVRDETSFTSQTGEDGFYEYIFSPVIAVDGSVELVAGSTRDITTRKAAEESIRFQAQLLDTVEQSVIATDLDGIVTYWNHFAEYLYGWSANETVGQNIMDLTTPDVMLEQSEEIMSRLRQGKSWTGEFDVRRKDGTTFPAHISNSPVNDGDGNLIGIVGISFDITPQKRREANLAFMDKINLELVQMTGIDEIMESVGTKIGSFLCLSNCTFMEIYEPADEAIVTHEWHREDATALNGVYRIGEFVTGKFQEASRAGETFVVGDTQTDPRTDAARFAAINVGAFVSVPLIRDGQWRFLLVIFDTQPRDWQGGEIELIRELTNRIWMRLERARTVKALRDSEQRLRLIMNSVKDYAIITTDTEGIINGWNPGAEKIFGYAESGIFGENIEILFTPEDRKKGVPAKEKRTALEKGSAEDDRWHLRKDGSRFYVSGLMQPLKDGKLDGFVKIARDMTEHIEAEQTRRDKEMLQKLVGAQEDERKRIARDLHDELGQLLTALRLQLEAIRKLCEETEICGKVDEAQLVAKQIDQGIDFLAWELRPAALDDFGLYAALIKYVREWSHYSGVTAELLDSGIEKARFSHEVETNLYRIAQESLNNVYKHAKAKLVEVSFDKRDDLIVLIMEDDGVGFKPEDKMNKDKGIGLIGMKERAALIGGTLEIESAPEKGTTIYVRVPISSINEV